MANCFLFFTICLLSASGLGAGAKIEGELFDYLFNSSYKREVRPVENVADVITVSFEYFLMRIVDVDEKRQILKTVAGLKMNWTDAGLKWDPDEFGGIDTIWVMSNEVWLPDVTLWNNAESDAANLMSGGTVAVSSSGMVTYDAKMILESFCFIEFFLFPFDEQICNFTFSPWRTSNRYLVLSATNATISEDIPTGGEWNVTEIDTIAIVNAYNFSQIHLTIIMERAPLFYIFNLIIPCIIIFALTLLGFSLPCDSGEKIGLSITILLSMAVFLTMSGDLMPPTASEVPIICQFLILNMILVAISTGMNVIVLKFWHHGPDHTDVPLWLRKITMNEYVLTALGMRDRFSKKEHEQNEPAVSPEAPLRSNVVLVDAIGNKVVYRLDYNAISPPSTPTPAKSRNSSADGDDDTVSPSAHCSNDPRTSSIVKEIKKVHKTLDSLVQRAEREDHENDVSDDWKQVACVIDRLFLCFFVIFSTSIFISLIAQMYSTRKSM
ncbi:neuronal acetylcholine receptor subunit alpha-7-like [Ptychodera flava]|uniref:neuronal acetylcholine receptor subunit alpha-7-like n=1 Tax=Ptychodera flava TaxID=63121 RepID=UPI00396AAEBB